MGSNTLFDCVFVKNIVGSLSNFVGTCWGMAVFADSENLFSLAFKIESNYIWTLIGITRSEVLIFLPLIDFFDFHKYCAIKLSCQSN